MLTAVFMASVEFGNKLLMAGCDMVVAGFVLHSKVAGRDFRWSRHKTFFVISVFFYRQSIFVSEIFLENTCVDEGTLPCCADVSLVSTSVHTRNS